MSFVNVRNGLIVSLCVVLHFIYRNRRKRVLPLPPGPPRWPIVKNTFTVPLANAQQYYKKLGAQLGSGLLYLEALGIRILVINDITIAQELLEKRSASYSSRPHTVMLTDVIRLPVFFANFPYGDHWKSHRRMFLQYFAERHLSRVQERVLEFIQKGLVINLLESPDDFREHISHCIGGLAFSLTYGLPIQRKDDPLIHFTEKTLKTASECTGPGYLVNIIPSLQYMPDWMPGTGFKQVAKKLRADLTRVIDEPFNATVKLMEAGKAPACYVTETLERTRQIPDHELQTKHTAAMVFVGVTETTNAVILTFILGMLMRPEVCKKAQEEIDRVVGGDRLPEYSDIPHLKYLSAVIKETLRWNPPAPLGIPHYTTESDTYMGYYIPKDCAVFANTYAMFHDEKVFPEPEEFKPERFIKDGDINDDLPNPETIASFGFGRRICPGAHIGRSTVYMMAIYILYLFDISPALDDHGNPIEVVPQFDPIDVISQPLPFKCKLTPRGGRDVKGLLGEYLETELI